MKRILTIIKYMFLKNLRDTGNTLLQMIVLPIALILILGMSLSPIFEYRELDPTSVGYLNEDEGSMSVYFDQFLEMPEISELLKVHQIDSLDQGLESLKKGELSALIHLEADFSAEVLSGGNSAIHITGHPERELRKAIVENLVEGFVSGANATRAMLVMGETEPVYAYTTGILVDHPVSSSGLMPGSMDYYAVTMLVMIIMYGALYSSFGMSESYLTNVGQRIKTTPISRKEQYTGLTLSSVLIVYLQVLVILAFTHFVFGVNWGDNIVMIMLIAFVLVVLANGLGVMVAMVTGNEMKSSNLINAFVVFSTFIAGGYWPINLPGLLNYIRYLSPNYLAQTAIFNTIYDGPADQVILMLAGMLTMIIACFMIAMIAERRAVK